ncbi:hypothetical protein ACFFGT_20585 [Mucilaginibacter angelicae]|uniref:Uncharacterized protein n=1 Tax=Mucilaginibacter angelicae TaxID=869718 RepID=A0ABV6LB12_9SPHI
MEIVDKIKEIFTPHFDALVITRSIPHSLTEDVVITIDANCKGKAYKRVFREAELLQLNEEGKLSETIRALCAIMLTSEE